MIAVPQFSRCTHTPVRRYRLSSPSAVRHMTRRAHDQCVLNGTSGNIAYFDDKAHNVDSVKIVVALIYNAKRLANLSAEILIIDIEGQETKPSGICQMAFSLAISSKRSLQSARRYYTFRASFRNRSPNILPRRSPTRERPNKAQLKYSISLAVCRRQFSHFRGHTAPWHISY